MSIKQSVHTYIQRSLNAMDDMFIAIEKKDTAKQHTALAALIGLVEMLRSEVDRGDDEEDHNGNPD